MPGVVARPRGAPAAPAAIRRASENTAQGRGGDLPPAGRPARPRRPASKASVRAVSETAPEGQHATACRASSPAPAERQPRQRRYGARAKERNTRALPRVLPADFRKQEWGVVPVKKPDITTIAKPDIMTALAGTIVSLAATGAVAALTARRGGDSMAASRATCLMRPRGQQSWWGSDWRGADRRARRAPRRMALEGCRRGCLAACLTGYPRRCRRMDAVTHARYAAGNARRRCCGGRAGGRCRPHLSPRSLRHRRTACCRSAPQPEHWRFSRWDHAGAVGFASSRNRNAAWRAFG